MVFVEIFKQNDGMLTSLVAEKMGIGNSQAAVMVDHFIADLRQELQSVGSYTIPTLGTLRTTGRSITFVAEGTTSNTSVTPKPTTTSQPHVVTPTLFSEKEEPAPTTAPKPAPAPKHTQPTTTRKTGRPTEYYAHNRNHEAAPSTEETTQIVNPTTNSRSTTNDTTTRRNTNGTPQRKPNNTPTSRPRPGGEHFRISTRQTGEEEAPHIRIRTNRKRKKPDVVTILAIIAVLLAVCAIIYGLISSPGPVIDEPLLPNTTDTTIVETTTPLPSAAE